MVWITMITNLWKVMVNSILNCTFHGVWVGVWVGGGEGNWIEIRAVTYYIHLFIETVSYVVLYCIENGNKEHQVWASELYIQ